MSNSTTYEGEKHVFYSDNNPTDGKIYLKAKPGQTLVLDGTASGSAVPGGSDQSVQFNSLGDLGGDSSFIYDTITNKLTIPHVVPEDIKSYKDSDDLGYSTIFQGPGQNFPQVINTVLPATNNFGTDIQASRESNVIAVACPDYVYAGSEGATVVYNQSVVDDPFTEYPSALQFTNFTLEATVSSASVNEAGNFLVMVDRSQNGYVYIYKDILGTWTFLADFLLGAAAVRLSTDVVRQALLVCDELSHFTVQDLVNPAQSLVDFAVPYDIAANGMAINKTVLGFYSGGYLHIYDYDTGTGLWSSVYAATDLVYPYSSIDIIQTGGGTGYIASVTNGNLYIIEDGTSNAFYGPYTSSCLNSTYVFAFKNNVQIDIFEKVGLLWVKQSQSYSTTGITKMSCNDEYLVCARLGTEDALILKIVPYVNNPILINTIDLIDVDNKLHIDTVYGAEFNETLVEIPNLLVNSSADILMSPGTVSAPSLSFAADSGLFYNGAVNTTVGGTTKLEVGPSLLTSANVLRITDGTVSLPAVSFTSDPDTGIYRIGSGDVGISLNGVKHLGINTTRVISTVPVLTSAGSVSNPGLAVGNYDTGLHQTSGYLGLTVGGINQLTTDATHTVSTAPIKHFSDGSASVPSFSWVNSASTGLYYTTNALNITANSAQVAKFNSSGAMNINKIYGLANPTNTYETNIAGAGHSFGTNAKYCMKMGPSGNNLTEVSVGQTCTLSSANATSGSVFKCSVGASGRWAQEIDVNGGATQHIVFTSTGVVTGSVTSSGILTSYNTTSDYRLKENVEPLTKQLDRIDLLNPVNYKWKNHKSSGEGFLAHELKEIFPEAVAGEKDAVDENGGIVPQGIDTSFLIGSLVACIKELRVELNAAKVDIEAMKKEMLSFV